MSKYLPSGVHNIRKSPDGKLLADTSTASRIKFYAAMGGGPSIKHQRAKAIRYKQELANIQVSQQLVFASKKLFDDSDLITPKTTSFELSLD
jgi:hypothetical protein